MSISASMVFEPANKEELKLSLLPKKCTCHVCSMTKQDAKEKLGVQRYAQLCALFGLTVQ